MDVARRGYALVLLAFNGVADGIDDEREGLAAPFD